MVLLADEAENVTVSTHALVVVSDTVVAAVGVDVSTVVAFVEVDVPSSISMYACAVVADRKFSRHSARQATPVTPDPRVVAAMVASEVPETPPSRDPNASVGVPVS